MFGWVRRWFGGKAQASARPRQSYDAARTTDHNRKHWQNADALSARAANTPAVRKKVRERARYERANNPYLQGMVQTLANDLIGTGPRLQLQSDPLLEPTLEKRLAALQRARDMRRVERAFGQWARAIGLAEKLRCMRMAKAVDGEAFAMLTTNPGVQNSVKLDVQVFECDRVDDPLFGGSMDPKQQDGIRFDEHGNPSQYFVYDEHPGDLINFSSSGRWIGARFVLHWYRKDRPGQTRGISEFMSSLPLFGQLRRFVLATLTAAETAADFAAVLESPAPANTDDDPALGQENPDDDFKPLEIVRGMMTQLPAGTKVNQVEAEHPATTFEMFETQLLKQVGRPVNMPFNVSAGDSSKHNYASGRLDKQGYYKSLRVERSDCETVVLTRIVGAWLDEAIMVPELIPTALQRDVSDLQLAWFWDGWEHVDPVKEAKAAETDVKNRLRSRTEICGERGVDWEEQVLPQLAREEELLRERGLDVAPALGTQPAADAGDEDEVAEREEEMAHAA
jgi:lambda family phage portal protein